MSDMARFNSATYLVLTILSLTRWLPANLTAGFSARLQLTGRAVTAMEQL